MRKRKAYFGGARRKNRHYPKLVQRSWLKGFTPEKVASWVRPAYERALQIKSGFAECWYPTITVPFDGK